MFEDRTDAGQQLAEKLAALAPADPVVLALPRGGVPVAAEVARRLGAPLDLILVRKIGVPGHEELAVGAVVEGAGATVFNTGVLRMLGRTKADFQAARQEKLAEIAARRARYLEGRAPVPLAGRTAIIVDDGIATGATARAALTGLAERGPARIILAVPVAPRDSLSKLRPLVDELICLMAPDPFIAVGAYYRDFRQLGDGEVVALMQAAARPATG